MTESVKETIKEQNEEDLKKIREIMNEVVELREEDLTELVQLGDRKNTGKPKNAEIKGEK